MKKELITELFRKFEEACYLIENTECWSARELQSILGYADWRNFMNAIDKAKNACEGAGEQIDHHFVDVTKMVVIGSGTQRRIDDMALTRYACYLIACELKEMKIHKSLLMIVLRITSRFQAYGVFSSGLSRFAVKKPAGMKPPPIARLLRTWHRLATV